MCRTSRWMPGIFRPANLACSGGALAGCRAYRPGWCRKRGLSGHEGLADGISKVGFPRRGRSAVRGQASVRLLRQGFQGSLPPAGGRPPRGNPPTFCRGKPRKRLGLICGWLPGICPSGNGRRLTCRTSRWMLGIFRPAGLACSGGALAGCRAYRPGWCRKRGLSGHGGLAGGISKVGFPI